MGLAGIKVETLSTPEDYLTFECEADTRHKFLDGKIYLMAGKSLPHSQICLNFGFVKYKQLLIRAKLRLKCGIEIIARHENKTTSN